MITRLDFLPSRNTRLAIMTISKFFPGLCSSVLLAGLLSGCAGWSNPIERISPHKIEIQQGNAIDQTMLTRLKPGMTPSQVRFVLGTPLLVDPFHDNRWDYVYRLEHGENVLEQRRITVVFEQGKLKTIEGAGMDIPSQDGAKP